MVVIGTQGRQNRERETHTSTHTPDMYLVVQRRDRSVRRNLGLVPVRLVRAQVDMDVLKGHVLLEQGPPGHVRVRAQAVAKEEGLDWGVGRVGLSGWGGGSGALRPRAFAFALVSNIRTLPEANTLSTSLFSSRRPSLPHCARRSIFWCAVWWGRSWVVGGVEQRESTSPKTARAAPQSLGGGTFLTIVRVGPGEARCTAARTQSTSVTSSPTTRSPSRSRHTRGGN